MDFEGAAERFALDQKKYRGRKDVTVSQKAKRQAEFQKKQQAKIRAERERKKRLEDFQKHYWHDCERALHVKPLSIYNKNNNSSEKMFQATSIHGDGDKIALPPSVLELLTSEENTDNLGNPWTFRIGIPNPDYKFPSSALIHTLKPPNDEHDDAMMMDDSEDEHDNDDKEAYMDELSYKYIAYTHCTVVEFTQEEGQVGIPHPIASALLNQKNKNVTTTIPRTRTKDPAQKPATLEDEPSAPIPSAMEETQTPGHLAWGAFDIPDLPLEITMLKLPKGKGCTLVPTKEAIQNNFYGLKDVKLVLEQSLIRTRATLSVGDIVSTWYRGVKFDLDVTKIIPSVVCAVTCINTDIEVDIGQTEEPAQPQSTPQTSSSQPETPTGHRLGTGQKLSSSSTTTTAATTPVPNSTRTEASKVLLPEPPLDQKENICMALIRYSGGSGKRRFDVTKATVNDLLAYAASLVGKDESTFRLVTRLPRRVFSQVENGQAALKESNIDPGQETFMLEFL